MSEYEILGALFWRHGHKDRAYELIFDPPLLHGQDHLRNQIKHAIKIYGPPRIIISSPMYRTLQTSKIMQELCKELGHEVNIRIDVNLHEYENTIIKPILLSTETREYYPNGINETNSGDLLRRLKYIINQLIVDNHEVPDLSSGNKWIVTHGSLIKKLSAMSNYKLKRIEEGSSIYLNFKIYSDVDGEINIIDNIISHRETDGLTDPPPFKN